MRLAKLLGSDNPPFSEVSKGRGRWRCADAGTASRMPVPPPKPPLKSPPRCPIGAVHPVGPVPLGSNVNFLQTYPVDVVIELGRTRLTIRQLAELNAEDVVNLDRASDQLLDVVVDGRVFARGTVVINGDRMSLRIVEVVGEENQRRTG